MNYTNSVFEQAWWLDIVASNSWDEILIKKNNTVIARFPFAFKGNRIFNPPFTQTLGIWMDDSIKRYEKGNSHLFKQKEIINEIVKKLSSYKNIDIILDSEVKYVLPFRWLGFSIEPTFSYRIENLNEISSLEYIISTKVLQRNKKASQKVTVDIDCTDNGIEKMIELMDMSFLRQKRKNPNDKSLLQKIMKVSIEHEQGIIMLAKDNLNNVHSGAFFLYDENVFYYLLGGQNPLYKNDGSQNLVITRGIEFASTVSKSFDFEGSMIEGIEHFFRQYGGKQIVNYRVVKKTIYSDIKNILKPLIKKILKYKT